MDRSVSQRIHRPSDTSHRLGELPALLRPDPVWTDEAVNQLAPAVQCGEDLADGLYTLAHPDTEYGAVIRTGNRYRSVYVAERGRQLIAAERTGDLLTMTMSHDRSAVAELVRRIPDATPATIAAVNLRRSELAAHSSSTVAFELAGGPQGQDLQVVSTLLGRSLVGQGELYVGVHDRLGRAVLSDPLRYQDYDCGRVLVVLTLDFLSLAPTGKSALVSRLTKEQQRITQALSVGH